MKIYAHKLLINNMKRRLLTVVVFLAALSAAVAQNWSVEIKPIFGARIGTVGEYVFQSDGKKMSQLNWDLKPLLYFGGEAAVSWRFLSLSLYGKNALPMRSGDMEDSDWLDSLGRKNVYSISNNFILDDSFSVGGTFMYTHDFATLFALRALASLDFSRTSFKASDGRQWDGRDGIGNPVYAYNDPRATIGYLPGDVISYRQDVFSVWLGIGGDFKFIDDRLKLSFSLAAAPYLYVQALDHHIERSTYFLDVIESVFSAYKIGAAVSFDITKSFSLSLDAAWIFSRTMRGNTYASYSQKGPWRKNTGGSGASFNYADISIAGAYRFDF